MRKILSLAMASAMVLSMAAVSFATTPNTFVVSNVYGKDDSGYTGMGTDPLGYGKTAYYGITTDGTNPVTSYDVVKELRVKPQWTQNADLVESVSVVKMKFKDTTNTGYFIAVKTVNKDTTSTAEIAGKIGLSVKSSTDSVKVAGGTAGKEATLNPFITLGYTQANGTVFSVAVDDADPAAVTATVTASQAASYELSDSDKLVEFGNVTLPGAVAIPAWDSGDADEVEDAEDAIAAAKTAVTNKKFAAADDFEFTLFGGAGTFTVSTVGQGKLLLSSSVKYNEGLEAIYPDANYVYINGNGKSFNKTGELFLSADEGSVLYQVKDGKLVKLNVAYDEYEEGFILKTRTLGTYVIAEGELDLSAQNVVETPVVEAPVGNPSTGVAL